MKKMLIGICLATISISGTALAVDEATVQAIEDKVSVANSKADGNNSRIQGLETAVNYLQNQIDTLGGAEVIFELCNLYELTGNPLPSICLDCGNGYLEPFEECDDGNIIGGDGCNEVCLIEECGDGKLDVGEECDDGNIIDGDACSSICQIEYKRVFITSRVYNGYLGGLNGADAKCNELAAAAGLSGTYKAWLSDGSINVSDRLTHFDGNYYLVDGSTLIATDWDDLTDGVLINPINMDESGNVMSTNMYVWTNTGPDGQKITTAPYDTCLGWFSNSYSGLIGDANIFDNANWTYYSGHYYYCAYYLRLYCFE